MREVAPLAAAQRPNVSERVGEEAEEEPETTLSTYALMRGVGAKPDQMANGISSRVTVLHLHILSRFLRRFSGERTAKP